MGKYLCDQTTTQQKQAQTFAYFLESLLLLFVA